MNTATTFTVSRFILCLICYPLAYYGQKEAFLIVLLLAVLTDALDGYVARKYGQITEYGAKLDTYADQFLLLSSAYWVYAFFPGILEWLTVPFFFIGWIIINNIISLYKHSRLANFHLYTAKAASGFLQFCILWTIAFGFNENIFWLSMFLILLAEIEISLVVLLMKKPKTNMKSYFV